jgi:hypothetical protein
VFGHRQFSDFDDRPIDKAEEAELDRYRRDSHFEEALHRYKNRDPSQNIPYLAGSDNEGETIFEDREFAKYVHDGKFKYKGQAFNPTEFLVLHEAVEGVLIRVYDLDYTKAHRLATIAERLAVEAAGYEWPAYQEAFKEPIARAERETGEGTPRNLLAVAYEGSPLYRKIEANEGVTVQDSGLSDEKAREAVGRSETLGAAGSGLGQHSGGVIRRASVNSHDGAGGGSSSGGSSGGEQGAQLVDQGGKLSHAEAGYHAGHGEGGAHCGICRFYQAGPHCRIVIDPIRPGDGCEHFKAKGQDVKAGTNLEMHGASAPKLAPPVQGALKQLGHETVHPQMTGVAKPMAQVEPHVHALALGGLPHMLAGGHISQAEHDRIHKSARTALANHKALGSGSATFEAGSGSHRSENEPMGTVGAMVHPGTGHDRGAPAPHIASPVGHGRHMPGAPVAAAGIAPRVKPAVPGSPIEPKKGGRRFGSLASMGMY